MPSSNLNRKNLRLLATLFLVMAVMAGLSFAAVPLYRLFCQVTGYGGTTQIADSLPEKVIDRKIRVRFNADTGRNLLWTFESNQRQVDVLLGQQGLMSFTAKNNDRVPVSAVAVYNVTPPKAGKYFHKIQCFCFAEQTLNPGEKATYPVAFFVDPALDADPNMQDVTNITLSYTFFGAETPELAAAMESFGTAVKDDDALAGTVALPPEKQ